MDDGNKPRIMNGYSRNGVGREKYFPGVIGVIVVGFGG